MAGIRDDHRSGTPTVGSIDQSSPIARVADNPFNRGGFGANDGDDPIGRDDITEADIDELYVHKLTKALPFVVRVRGYDHNVIGKDLALQR